jgi:hypothetical protein
MIVDNLRVFQHPVFVYIPHEAEIRGGAWVVIDPNINPAQVREALASVLWSNKLLSEKNCSSIIYNIISGFRDPEPKKQTLA